MLPKGDDSENRECRGENYDWGDDIEPLVDVSRSVFFLEDELEPVRRRLAEAEEGQILEAEQRQRCADPVGTDAVLHPGRHPPLEQHEIGGSGHETADEDADFNEGCDDHAS